MTRPTEGAKAAVMGQRGPADFIVELHGVPFIVQDDRISIVRNVDSQLARGYWEETTIGKARHKRVIRLVESFVNSLPVVLDLGAEVGSLCVRAIQSAPEPTFLMERVDQSGLMLDDEDLPTLHTLESAESWGDLLVKLDVHPWQRLHPYNVGPSFRGAILEAVRVRLRPGDPRNYGYLERWEQACAGEREGG